MRATTCVMGDCNSVHRVMIRRVMGVMKVSGSVGSNSSSDTICCRMGVAILAQKREKNDGVLGSASAGGATGVEAAMKRRVAVPGCAGVRYTCGVLPYAVLRESPRSLVRRRLLGLSRALAAALLLLLLLPQPRNSDSDGVESGARLRFLLVSPSARPAGRVCALWRCCARGGVTGFEAREPGASLLAWALLGAAAACSKRLRAAVRNCAMGSEHAVVASTDGMVLTSGRFWRYGKSCSMPRMARSSSAHGSSGSGTRPSTHWLATRHSHSLNHQHGAIPSQICSTAIEKRKMAGVPSRKNMSKTRNAEDHDGNDVNNVMNHGVAYMSSWMPWRSYRGV